MHVHVHCADGEAKFWIEPEVELVLQRGLSARQIGELQQLIEEKRDVIADAWRRHFS